MDILPLMLVLVLASVLVCHGYITASRNYRSSKWLLHSTVEDEMKVKEEPKLKEIFLRKDKLESADRSEFSESIVLLEKNNPTPNPTESALFNGVWELISFGGITSPGLLAFQAIKAIPGDLVDISDVELGIKSVEPRVEATSQIKVGNTKVDVKIVNDLFIESPIRVRETFVSGTIGNIDIPFNAQLSRTMFVTYLDDDLMIVRDKFGSPDVLRRKEMEFPAFSTEATGDAGIEDGSPAV